MGSSLLLIEIKFEQDARLCAEVRTIENAGLDKHSCASLEDRAKRMAGGSA